MSKYTDLPKMLEEFQAKMGLEKQAFDRSFLQERLKFMQEELIEYHENMYLGNPVEVLDALVDLVYYAIGTSTLLNWDFNEAFRRVHAANMQKVRLHSERSAVDIVKPQGWKPADLSNLV